MRAFDLTDWIAFSALALCFVYLFKHPSDAAFAVIGGIMTGFHGLRIWDQKRPDAG